MKKLFFIAIMTIVTSFILPSCTEEEINVNNEDNNRKGERDNSNW
jgi:hypothetical protein